MPHFIRFRHAVAMAVAGFALASAPAFAQKAYPSAEAAAQAFFDAIANYDENALRIVLGNDWKRFVPAGEVDREDVYGFLEAYAKQHKVVSDGAGRALLSAGTADWTLPIPIVKSAAGWHFDPRAGVEQMKTRRIGRNELAAMNAALAYFDAQKDYAQVDRDGNGVLEYAQKFASSPGRHDGLYWSTGDGAPESPLGPIYAPVTPGEGYHGYRFKILKAQGPNAPGGAYDYVIGRRMRGGFALVAWPVKYGESGVMSFMVSHDGVVYEKNLGPHTDATARAMTRFDPDRTWSKVDVQ